MVAINSINYLDPQFHEITKKIEEKEKKHDAKADQQEEVKDYKLLEQE